ncbi:hypothetical protein C5167_016318 [Papaver somniferum]|nr:hypothetical protein C5167_016318 [Papaver somniferum]
MSEVVGDRISNLPASLLLHILSFVDTTDAARTGILSKRWKYIWRSIPILQFGCQNSSQTDTFMDFVDRTLELHDDSNIQEFSLVSSVLLSDSRIQKWITTFAQFFPAEEEEDIDGEDNHNNEDEGEDDHNNEDESEDNHNNEDETDLSEGEDDDNEDECWALDMVATRCSFLQRLMLVLFKKFTGNARELRWLKLIFKNAKDLKVVDISSDSVSHGKSNSVMADILSFPRASASGLLTLSSKQGSEVKVFSW